MHDIIQTFCLKLGDNVCKFKKGQIEFREFSEEPDSGADAWEDFSQAAQENLLFPALHEGAYLTEFRAVFLQNLFRSFRIQIPDGLDGGEHIFRYDFSSFRGNAF